MTNASQLPSGGSGAMLLSNGGTHYALGDLPAGMYLTYQDVITFGLQSRTVSDIGQPIIIGHCRSVSSEANGYLRKRYKLPLAGWGMDFVEKLAIMAGYRALSGPRGFNPEGDGANRMYERRYMESLAWLRDVRDYKIDPDFIEGTPATATPRMTSEPSRGW